MWSGSASSLVDLNPPERTSSLYGMAQGVQVGRSLVPGSSFHAAVWHGAAATFGDFNSTQAESTFYATTGHIHVGQGGTGPAGHAIVSFGTPDAWLDLHQFLPPGYSTYSAASAV